MEAAGAHGGARDTAKRVARSLALSRAALGTAFALAPTVGGRGWVGEDARRPGARVFLRGLGARDVGIALGTLQALSQDRGVRPWAEAAAVADGADFLAVLAEARSLPRGAVALALAMAGGSTAVGLWLSAVLD